MLPALVDPAHPGGACARPRRTAPCRGAAARRIYGQGTFDAGGPCARGVPTVMYGASGGVGLRRRLRADLPSRARGAGADP